MRGYFKKLETETNWFKLFIPDFLWVTFCLVVLLPVIKYIIEVLIRHKEYSGNHIVNAIVTSLLLSAADSGIKCYSNRKNKKSEQ